MSGDGKGSMMLTTGFNPPQTVEYYRQHFAFAGPLQIDYAQRFWNLERQHIDDLDRQADFAGILSSFSPASIYKWLSETVTGTDRDSQGYDRQVDLLQQAGIRVMRSNAESARLALHVVRVATGEA